ncbi:MAG TPA: DUF2459 domain-containing protein [Abditibacteriaceae bacterium]|nr:DUF2459 domain-containing protein [Abditibacteriaceae bacterium]
MPDSWMRRKVLSESKPRSRVGAPSKSRRQWRRFWLVGWIALLGLPPVYMTFATPPAGAVLLSALPSSRATAPRYRVFVVGWDYHTSIIMEQPQLWRLGPPGAETARFVEYGWGDRSFYMDSNFWPHALFATVSLPTASVLYVNGWNHPPRRRGRVHEIYVREVTARQFQTLVIDLERAMPRTSSGRRAAALPAVHDRAGRFYAGREFYIFWSDCNKWTVDRLQAAGLADAGTLVVFKQQVAGRLRGFRRAA